MSVPRFPSLSQLPLFKFLFSPPLSAELDNRPDRPLSLSLSLSLSLLRPPTYRVPDTSYSFPLSILFSDLLSDLLPELETSARPPLSAELGTRPDRPHVRPSLPLPLSALPLPHLPWILWFRTNRREWVKLSITLWRRPREHHGWSETWRWCDG